MVYVVFYLILYKNGSIMYLPAHGGVTMELQAPTLNTVINGSSTDKTIPCCKDDICSDRYAKMISVPVQTEACTGPPCDPELPECYRFFDALQLLPYCTQSGLADRATNFGMEHRVPNLNCTYWYY
jgi:hypothetical protein